MAKETEKIIIKDPQIDFSFQLNLARDKSEKKIFAFLKDISQKLFDSKEKLGVLIVLGIFGSNEEAKVNGMRYLSKRKIDEYLNINFAQYREEISKLFLSGNDGAIIINQDGQILGDGIYLNVSDPNVEIPEGTGTRHISAASFSQRPDVLAAFTLSEETRLVRVWKEGAFTEQFCPEIKEDENNSALND